MTAYLSSLRATLRIARRTAQRSRARSLLILCMILLPVFAGAALVVVARSSAVPWQQEAEWVLGQADLEADLTLSAKMTPNNSDGTPIDPLATLPAGSRVLHEQRYEARIRTDAGTAAVEARDTDLTSPIAAGRYRMLAGRAPSTVDEVVLSRPLAQHLSVSVGEEIRVGKDEEPRRVVGLVDRPGSLRSQFLLTAPGAPPTTRQVSDYAMVDLPENVKFEDLDPALASVAMNTRESFRPVPSTARGIQSLGIPLLIVGFAITEVVLLAGAAFAVGARRQTRELGLVAATGGSTRHVAQIVLGGGVVLGLAAGVVGAALGVLAVVVGHPWVERAAGHVVEGTTVPYLRLVGVVLLAVVAGLAAAALPARGAARQTVLAALSGRRAQARTPRQVVYVGLATVAFAAVLVAVGAAPPARIELVTAGSIIGLGGFAVCAPALVGVAGRFGRYLPMSGRLALRDAARNRNRTGAAVAAVTAAVAGSVALSLYLASNDDAEQRRPTSLRVGQLQIYGDSSQLAQLNETALTPVTDALPVRDVLPLRRAEIPMPVSTPTPTSTPTYSSDATSKAPSKATATATPEEGNQPLFVMQEEGGGGVYVGDSELIRAALGREAPPEAVRALAEGKAVVLQPGVPMRDGAVEITVSDSDGSHVLRVPAITLPNRTVYYTLPAVVIGEETARSLGAEPTLSGYLLDTTRVPTAAEEERARKALDDLSTTLTPDSEQDEDSAKNPMSFNVERGHQSDLAVTLLALVGLSGVVTLVATGISVGLAAAESRHDVSTLAAIGAAPRLRRVLSVAQAGVIAGLGTLLGVPAGILPAAGVVGMRDELEWATPWGPLALMAVAVPVLAMLLSGLVTRSRLTLVRRLS